MRKPGPTVVYSVMFAVYCPPLFQVALQAINGDKITQKLPPSIGLQVLATASASTDTGPVIRPVPDMILGKLIRMPQPEEPGQVQLPPPSDTTDTG